jgi:hypothetical protein
VPPLNVCENERKKKGSQTQKKNCRERRKWKTEKYAKEKVYQ